MALPLTVTVTANATDDGPGLTYFFDWGDGTTTGWQNGIKATHQYYAAGTYTITVTVMDADDQTAVASAQVRAYNGTPPSNTAPTVTLAVSPSSGTTAPLDVVATATATDDAGGLTYVFDPGDGSGASSPQAGVTYNHTYTSTGTYTFSVTVTDAGALTATATKKVSITDTTNPDRVIPGHPGQGKIYISAYFPGNSYTNMKSEELNQVQPRTYTDPDTSQAVGADTSRFFGTMRVFHKVGDRSFASGSGSRTAALAGKIVWVSWSGSSVPYFEIIAGTRDAWINNLIADFKELKSAGIKVWWSLENEPDAGKADFGTASKRTALRNAYRYMKQKFSDARLDNMLGCVPGPHISDSFWNTSRNHGWWEYHPDWKGTETTTGGYYNNIWNVNPKDFYLGPWDRATGKGRITDAWGQNTYCWHSQGGTFALKPENGVWSWSDSPNTSGTNTQHYQAHNPFKFDDVRPLTWAGNQHSYRMRFALDKLYGKNVMPIAFGEFGYSIAEFDPPGTADPDEALTMTQWKSFYDQFIENNVILCTIWKRETSVGDCEYNIGGRFVHVNFNSNGTAIKPWAVTDPTDSRRKALAMWMDQPETVNGPLW